MCVFQHLHTPFWAMEHAEQTIATMLEDYLPSKLVWNGAMGLAFALASPGLLARPLHRIVEYTRSLLRLRPLPLIPTSATLKVYLIINIYNCECIIFIL